MVEELCTRPASTWILLTSESWGGARVQERIAMPCSTWRRMLSDVSDRRVGGQWSRLGVRGSQCTPYRVLYGVGDMFLALVRSCSPRGPICSFRVILHAIKSRFCMIGGLCVAVEVR